MKWKGRRSSNNVTDKRGETMVRTAGAGAVLHLVGRLFGMKGILWLVGIVAVLFWLSWPLALVTFAILPLAMIWIYLMWLIYLFGAELNAALHEVKRRDLFGP